MSVAIGDFDGDSHLDLAVANVGSDNVSILLNTTGCPDNDGDGYTDEACGGIDCDDSDPDVNPGADEDCDNGIDDDCDGLIDYPDDPDCEFTLELDASCDAGTLSLGFTMPVFPLPWAQSATIWGLMAGRNRHFGRLP